MSDKSKIEWTDELKKRFWSYVRIGEPDECWPWKGGLFTNGYGQFRFGKKKLKAHRCAYILTNGLFPRGKPKGLHSCDNPPCCNPAHIFPGTLSDNARDRHSKGRAAPCVLCPLRGEENPSAKLCVGQILEIRAFAQSGESQRKIAQKYNVSQSQIGNIVKGRSWATVLK
jgi:hypothetical protein